MNLTDTERRLIQSAYDRVTARLEDLELANDSRPSDLRTKAIEELTVCKESVEGLDFLEKTDFSIDEIRALTELSGEAGAMCDGIQDTHELTLLELETDFAELLQSVMSGRYVKYLMYAWVTAMRRLKLPRTVPEDVVADFNVGVYNKAQTRLNQIAFNAREVTARQCLNSDDYGQGFLFSAKFNAVGYSAQEAIDNYVTLQQLKEAERAARAANEVSIGGMIWDVIGWDSPTDFLLDVGLMWATGGFNKLFKWGKKVRNITKRVSKSVTTLEKALSIEARAVRAEKRIAEIRRAADALRKTNNLVQLPKKIAAAFKVLNTARGKQATYKAISDAVTRNYISALASTFTAKGVLGTGSKMQAGSTATKVAVLMRMRQVMDASALGVEIQAARSRISFTAIVVGGFNSKNLERLAAYFAMLWIREMVIRLIYMEAHKRTVAVKAFVDEAFDAATFAFETIIFDLPGVSKGEASYLAKTIIGTVDNVLDDLFKNLFADNFLKP